LPFSADAWLRILKPQMNADGLGSETGIVRTGEWDKPNARSELDKSAFISVHLRFQASFGNAALAGGAPAPAA
jgi:hypothetical protein